MGSGSPSSMLTPAWLSFPWLGHMMGRGAWEPDLDSAPRVGCVFRSCPQPQPPPRRGAGMVCGCGSRVLEGESAGLFGDFHTINPSNIY